jgi:hypothetical protein
MKRNERLLDFESDLHERMYLVYIVIIGPKVQSPDKDCIGVK